LSGSVLRYHKSDSNELHKDALDAISDKLLPLEKFEEFGLPPGAGLSRFIYKELTDLNVATSFLLIFAIEGCKLRLVFISTLPSLVYSTALYDYFR
jgi:hypothetical protein